MDLHATMSSDGASELDLELEIWPFSFCILVEEIDGTCPTETFLETSNGRFADTACKQKNAKL